MNSINEDLLSAWLQVSTSIVNSRVVSELSYNETLVCNLLHRNYLDQKAPITATDLCKKTNMLKSQMNRTLNLLETKGIISRQRSSNDKRQVLIIFNIEQANPYKIQHQRILQLLDEIISELGQTKTEEIIKLLTHVANIADNIFKER